MTSRGVSTLLLIAAVLATTNTFIPNCLLDFLLATLELTSFDSVNHRDMTGNAVLLFAQTLLADNPNPVVPGSADAMNAVSQLSANMLQEAHFGSLSSDQARLFRDVIDKMQDSNEDMDTGPEQKLAAAHFDREQILPTY